MSKDIREEFKEFQSLRAVSPPEAVSKRIFSQVHADLNPSAIRVFSKLMGVHVLTAAVTLSICPQFGFRVLGEGMGLMHIFMAFGTYGCLIACGAFFTGMSLFVASLVLRPEELRQIRKNRLLSAGAVTLLSLGFFIMLDAEVVFGLAIAWFLGAIAGSLLTLELGWALRFKLASHRA